jgi:ribulose-phosphate 3-epimerase
MASEIEIIPAIMPQTRAELEEKLRAVESYVSSVQIDVMDGKFVEGMTWPYRENEPVELPHAGAVQFEIDLMIERPETVIDAWQRAGARRIIVHIESTNALEQIISQLNPSRVSLGVAIDTATPLSELELYLNQVDFVQCMGIAEIGKQGEPFDERVLKKLSELRAARPSLILSVDGAVHLDNAKRLVEAGANRLVSGSEILMSVDVGAKIAEFHAIVGAV